MSAKFLHNTLLLIIMMITIAVQGQQAGSEKPEVDPYAKFIDAKKLALTGQPEKAITAFEAIYKSDRLNDAVAFELAKLYEAKGDVLLSRKYIESALRNSPQNIYYNDFYTSFLFKTEEFEKVEAPLEILLTKYPDDLRYLDMGIDAAISLKNKKLGEAYLARLSQQYGKSEKALTRIFEYYDQTKDPRAEASLLEITDRFSTNKSYLKMLASWYAKENKRDKSIEAYRKVLQLDPNDTDANLVVLETSNKTEEQGLAYVRSLMPLIKNTSIDLDAKIKELMPFLKEVAQNKDSSLITALKEIGENLTLAHPREAKAHAFYADALLNAGLTSNAVKQYEKTLELNDTNFDIWEQLMNLYIQRADYQKFESVAYKAYDLFPNKPMAYFFYGKALISNNKAQDALEISDEGLMVSSGNGLFISKLETIKAEAFLSQKKTDQAKLSIDKAMESSNKQNPIAFKLLGDYLEQTGDHAEAVKAWQTASNMGYVTLQQELFMRGIKY